MDRIQTDQNLGPVFTAVDVVVFALSTTFVLLRLGTRFFITRNPGWDDATILLAQVSRAFLSQSSLGDLKKFNRP